MRTIFWNVDTQYDFMRSDGKLYVSGAENLEPTLEELTRFAKERGITVVNTADWHNKDTEEISDNPDFKTTFPEHCMESTKGAMFVPATNPESPYIIDWKQERFSRTDVENSRNIVLYKDKFNIFTGSPHTERVLEIVRPGIAVAYGVATNVCVDDAVMGLIERKVRVYVPLDAIKELPNLPLPYKKWEENGAILTYTKNIYEMLEEEK